MLQLHLLIMGRAPRALNPKPQEAAADLITLRDPLMTKLNEHSDKLTRLTALKVMTEDSSALSYFLLILWFLVDQLYELVVL